MKIESVMTPRLLAIAAAVPEGASLADIGTDHAYIPIYLCLTGKIQSALAMDVRPGPLARAEENINRYGLAPRIKTRLSDGLSALLEKEADTAVLAGMGGLLIAELLEKAPVTLQTYILQPMTAVAELRQYLAENGYVITDEVLAQEGEKLYTVMTVQRGQQKPLDPVYYLVGQKLLEKRDPLAPQFISALLEKYTAARDGLQHSDRPESKEKEALYGDIIASLKRLKEACEAW